jgi:Tol biopolymer transport system component
VPLTEEGAIVGSVPYMSPEQAEGRPVDARSDIFSFGAVLYEMVTGQRAFRGDSRISTLAAVVEKEPQPISETGAVVPSELERLIIRCLRKDLNRRSQSIADVKLALEELRDDSESGKLGQRPVSAPARRRWLWPAVCAAIAVGADAWAYLHQRGAVQPQARDLVRLSPDDGHMYDSPSISPDGRFVVYVSDRSGQKQAWLQQVGAGDPIQLTHTTNPVWEVAFSPTGTQILYTTWDASSFKGSIEVIPTLGGQARVLRTVGGSMQSPAISPDGRQVAFTEYLPSGRRLMLLPLEGGPTRELTTGSRMMKLDTQAYAWSPDSRWLIINGSGAQYPNGWEWFALPVDGGNPIPTGAGDAMRAEGFSAAPPTIMQNGRVVFMALKDEREKLYDIRISRGQWRVTGAPRQLTFGIENAFAFNASSDGTVAVEMGKESSDLYLVPLDARSGQAKGVTRRLTQDGRDKQVAFAAGEARNAYFWALDLSGSKIAQSLYALDLESGQQTLLISRLDRGAFASVSRDGRQIAYSVPEGDSYSIRVGEAGADPSATRVVCKGCGVPRRFSPDGRFLLYSPERQPNLLVPTNRKWTVRLMELASGKDRPWLEHPTESVWADSVSDDGAWLAIRLVPPGSVHASKHYLVPWRDEPVPVAEWVEAPVSAERWEYSPSSGFLYSLRDSNFISVRFDAKTRTFGEPFDTKAANWKPGDHLWQIRGPGLVYSRQETHGSVWLMKLPE